ncbi:threonylcarbamoyladenosine tRNA methylthiotransferase [Sitodiplosis mosellana]|uniref:threonylcarbamoyladenosine tRNA methylthiotransferase n=1 Tax=Sitodiplosis mosellana TaxID=263140 RepID=UPI0024439883|nr:threonylcarbamoyladenosine tRNA methylthiotransferase [Sitodiplosis mosellana]
MEKTSACNEIIDDIEDLISSQDITPKERYANKKDVTVRAKKRQPLKISNGTTELEKIERPILESVIPGTQKVYVKTWGCAHNNSDSEYMAGQLASYGYNLTGDKGAADLWLLNSCTVKNPSEDTFRNEIQSGLDTGKHVVVAGCVPQGAPKSDYLKGLSIIGVRQIDRIVEVVEETLKGHTVRLLQPKKVNGKYLAGAPLDLPKIRKNPLVEIIAINTGCLNQCTYCKTKHSRGNLSSYPPEEIIARAVQAFKQGVCEIWLTSEDTGTYGRDIGTSLPELLWKLTEVIPDGCMLRVGMTNPPYILEHLEEIAKIFQTPRVYSFLHVPVQSGSDSVLGEMKREYCRKEFEQVVDILRARVPGITIATDIICGFPTETEADFEETMTLCEKYKFPSLFINQFYPRPGTPAAQMKRIPANLVKTRTKRLTDLFNSYEPYADRVGQEYVALVTDISHDKKYYVGHNKFYEQILLPMKENLLGKSVRTRITSVTKFSMLGELLDAEEKWQSCSTSSENVHEKIAKATLESSETNGCVTNWSSDDNKNAAFIYAMVALFLALVYRYIWKFLSEIE